MPEPPLILGKWNSSEFHHLERALHAVLKVRGKWITEASGVEWFRTSLAEIQLIIDFFGKNRVQKTPCQLRGTRITAYLPVGSLV